MRGLSVLIYMIFFFQAEDGIRYLVRSRGLGDVYKRQFQHLGLRLRSFGAGADRPYPSHVRAPVPWLPACICLLYTSDAADERSSVDLGGRRIIKQKQKL